MVAYAKPEQKQTHMNPVQKKESTKTVDASNQTGAFDYLKTQNGNFSGVSFDDVRIHYNSDKPAQLQALANTQTEQGYVTQASKGSLGGVIQRKQDHFKYTAKFEGAAANNYASLEREAFNKIDTGATIQMETPAEDFLKTHPDYPVDHAYALIGSDSNSPYGGGHELRDELERCEREGMMMPETLAKRLFDEKREGHVRAPARGRATAPGVWSMEKNTQWISDMIKGRKVFSLVHTAIISVLNEGDNKSARDFEHNARVWTARNWGPDKIVNVTTNKGTWNEVYTLIGKGYTWHPARRCLLPPGINIDTFEEALRERPKYASEPMFEALS